MCAELLFPPAGSPASAPAGSTAAGGPPGGALLPARSGHFRWRAFGVDSHPLRRLFRQDTASRRESRAVPHPYRRPILRTPASASLQSGRAQSRFAPAHPAARFSCAVPPPQERPGPQASVRSTRPLRPDPPEKKSPAPFRNGRGRGECVWFLYRSGLQGVSFSTLMWWPL